MNIEDQIKSLRLKIKATQYIIGWYVYGTEAMREVEKNNDYNLIELELSEFDKHEVARLEAEKKQLAEELQELEYTLFNQDREDEVSEDGTYQDWQMNTYGNIK